MFTFDSLGSLQTDFVKTDSRSYLHFKSAALTISIPVSFTLNALDSGGSEERLKPSKNTSPILRKTSLPRVTLGAQEIVENISNMVLNSERSLLRKVQVFDNQTSLYLPIRVISTYGSDNDLVSMTKKYKEHLSRTRSFSESDTVKTSQVTSSTAVTPSQNLRKYSVTPRRQGQA